MDVFGRAAPHPVGTSFAVEVYRLLPNDTDFTAVPRADDFVGLNSAYIDGGAIYHTPLDTPASMDRGSLQQHGDNALGLARAFGAHRPGRRCAPAATPPTSRCPARWSATRAGSPGRWPCSRWPRRSLWAGVLPAQRPRGLAGRVAAGFGLALVPIVVAPVAAQLLWLAVTAIRPGYAELLDPYRPTSGTGWPSCARRRPSCSPGTR